MAIKFSQFNLRTDSTPTMFLVGYDGNQNIHITVDNLLNNVINGTENTIAMFGPGGTSVIDSAITQQTIIGSDKLVTVQGFLNIDEDVSVDRDLTVTRNSILNGNVQLGNGSADLITQYGTLYLNGPVKDKDNNFGGADQVLVSNISSELRFTDLTGIAVGSAEVVEVPVKNLQGSPLTKGDPVYILGDVGASGRLEVKLADASNAAKMPALGLLKQDLGINEEGLAVITGKLRNLPTDPIDGQTPLANDVIYVKAGGTTGAALTLTKPTGSNLIQNMGKVGRVSTSNDGTFVVSSILRTNDIPNLTPGKIWVGSTGNTIESQTLFVDEANGRLGINETNPGYSLDVDGTLQTSGWAYFATTGPTSIARLGGASTTTSQFNISTAATGGSFIAATNTLALKTNNVDAIKIDNAAAVQFNLYGNGVYTGTAAHNLSVDSSGNIIETSTSASGSGTTDTLPIWSDGPNGVLSDSIITQTSLPNKITIGGELSLQGSGDILNISHYQGSVWYIDTSTGDDILFGKPGANNQNVGVQGDLYAYDGDLGTKNAGIFNNLISRTGNSYFNVGNVGIGTTFPSTKLEVAGNTTGTLLTIKSYGGGVNDAAMRFYNENDGPTYVMGLDSSDSKFKIAYDLDGSNLTTGTKLVIDTSGNVGIGTTNPARKLDVVGDIQISDTGLTGPRGLYGPGGTSLITHNPTTLVTEVADGRMIFDGNSFDFELNAAIAGTIMTHAASSSVTAFYTGGSEAMRLTGLKLGIGTTSPQAKLDVNGGVRIANDTAAASATNVGTLRYRTSGNNSYVDMVMQTGASTYAWVNIVENNW